MTKNITDIEKGFISFYDSIDAFTSREIRGWYRQKITELLDELKVRKDRAMTDEELNLRLEFYDAIELAKK